MANIIRLGVFHIVARAERGNNFSGIRCVSNSQSVHHV